MSSMLHLAWQLGVPCMMYVKWVFGILHGVVFVGCKEVVCCTPDITHYVYRYSDEWKLIQK